MNVNIEKFPSSRITFTNLSEILLPGPLAKIKVWCNLFERNTQKKSSFKKEVFSFVMAV